METYLVPCQPIPSTVFLLYYHDDGDYYVHSKEIVGCYANADKAVAAYRKDNDGREAACRGPLNPNWRECNIHYYTTEEVMVE